MESLAQMPLVFVLLQFYILILVVPMFQFFCKLLCNCFIDFNETTKCLSFLNYLLHQTTGLHNTMHWIIHKKSLVHCLGYPLSKFQNNRLHVCISYEVFLQVCKKKKKLKESKESEQLFSAQFHK